ncbi:MAG: class I tRNA ligase family protein, partial [Clostridiaceae bacterium]
TGDVLRVFTTRPDTLFGATFMVISPEHPLLEERREQIKNYDEVIKYQEDTNLRTEFERTQMTKDKTGVRLDGLTAINPVNDAEIPIFISDYVLMSYGTGAIMGVPSGDQRDWEFATKFGIDIIEVVSGGDITKEAYGGDGVMVNSGFLNGIDNIHEAVEKIMNFLEEKGMGKRKINYKLMDWIFSR